MHNIIHRAFVYTLYIKTGTFFIFSPNAYHSRTMIIVLSEQPDESFPPLLSGTPNKPTVTKVGSVKDLVFEWTIDDEDGLRPVDCYYGNITESVNSGTTDSLKETVHVFNFCGSSDPTAQEYAFKEYDSIKDYIIVVCARNRLGGELQ